MGNESDPCRYPRSRSLVSPPHPLYADELQPDIEVLIDQAANDRVPPLPVHQQQRLFDELHVGRLEQQVHSKLTSAQQVLSTTIVIEAVVQGIQEDVVMLPANKTFASMISAINRHKVGIVVCSNHLQPASSRLNILVCFLCSMQPRPVGDSDPRSLVDQLNADQRTVYDRYQEGLRRGEQQLLVLHGPGGCGKTHLVRCILTLHPNGTSITSAFTGNAAFQVQGVLFFSSFGINVITHETDDSPSYLDYKRTLRRARLIVVDEVSMLRLSAIKALDKRLRLLHSNPSVPFGGINIILCGDFYQLSPIAGKPIYLTCVE